eukprot:12998798-Alexandrium_andersonii.AAC.1
MRLCCPRNCAATCAATCSGLQHCNLRAQGKAALEDAQLASEVHFESGLGGGPAHWRRVSAHRRPLLQWSS